jgi:hypothetical protein
MPLYHCTECHHEETTPEPCDWCSAPMVLIAEKLPEDAFWDGGWRDMLNNIRKTNDKVES